jgi:xylulokinase
LPTFSEQGPLSRQAPDALGIAPGTPVAYRAGHQPNNAFSLNALSPGDMAATAGTSGVVYGIDDQPRYDDQSRVNTFLHVNHRPGEQSRYGTLMCVNGTGILNRWLHDTFGVNSDLSYEAMNDEAEEAPVGAEGVSVLPFGNGAERTLENLDPGASIHGLNFNVHDRSHLLRAAQEGIVFALRYGIDIMTDMGLPVETVRAAHANMFLSPVFRQAFATVTNTTVELIRTDGAEGAARGAGLGVGLYGAPEEAFEGLERISTIAPDPNTQTAYAEAYDRWQSHLNHELSRLRA